ncbi:substrate-binding domain-containing protein [Rhizobium sp. VS19-DR104.2]|uniref:substrate-binding domain-containing protein n=2 Tax=Rhizobium TaxID=379 RepID=UPI001CC59C3A|nr:MULTISPECIES: substrate-binding domain-containing protein [unclassified Rhizobium]MBZ5804894.1 substrate-binding domain-containing protein [Rhizobium sp. VS19-DR181]MBZ5763023.1 substrate-binding domain-containing protein [Rhizobium sp. VS19-DR96]MBZ5768802.1 substrate-binding domain-containing protein [Rhizobium sp. VS19-DR129.2]MBZ5776331.1 substrate-binding domain-containing protein [Rhizobium sp. VS19-DRK62.2]MBZ5787539.1 substrate-binding domain-containing protein [Rhizobium sp. VS19-D
MLIRTFLTAAMITSAMIATAHAQTVGPAGETATPSANIKLTDGDLAALKGKGYKAALLWHTSSDFINAVSAGAKDEFARAGVDVVVSTDAGFDAAKQRSDIETALAAKPNVILALPLDPTTSAAAFRQAIADGTKLVFLSNLPADYKQGSDYAAIVTDDLYQMGKHAADALAKSIGGKGKVGYIFHDASYYVTNQRDQAFKSTIEKDYPDIKIVAEQGISDPARAEELASAMLLKNPDLDGIYVTWAEPAEGVLAALRSAGNTKTKIVTLDLSEPVALDMVKGGNVVALVADKAYELGQTMAITGMEALLGQKTPPFIVAPALSVTKADVAEGWKQSLNRDAPQSLLDAAK